jgi:hypothetical protein
MAGIFRRTTSSTMYKTYRNGTARVPTFGYPWNIIKRWIVMNKNGLLKRLQYTYSSSKSTKFY